MKGGVFHAAPQSLVPNLRPGRRPLVAEPDAHGIACGRVRVAVEPQLDPAPDLRLALHRADLPHDVLHGTAQKLLAAGGDLDLVARQRGSLLAEGPFPVGALGGLDAVLVRHPHEDALVGELLQLDRHGVAEGPGVACDFLHKQIGERPGVRANPEVDHILPGQLPDQEHEAAQVGAQRALRRAIVELRDAGVDLVEKHVRAHQVGGERAEQIAGRNHGSQGLLRNLLERVVQDPELGTELALRTRRVGGLEACLPEAPAGSQKRVVAHMVVAVLGAHRQTRPVQVSRHLARVVFEHLLDGRSRRGALPQQHLARDRLHLGVGELDGRAEAVAEPLQRLRARGKRGLARGDEEHAAVEPRLKRLGKLGDGRRAVLRLVDVLLHLVEHEDGRRDLALRG